MAIILIARSQMDQTHLLAALHSILLGSPVFCFGAPRQVIQLNLETAKLGGRTNFGIFILV